MTENVTGYNTRLARGAATGVSLPAFASDAYSDILDIEELTKPSPSRQVDEFYVLDLASAKKLVGSITYSPCAFTIARAFADAIHDSLEDDANAASSVRRNWRITLPDSGNQIDYFIGYCSKFETAGINNQGRIQCNVEIVVDGGITIQR
jgi:hypothetical protein